MRARRWIVGGGLIVAAVAAYVAVRPQEPEPVPPQEVPLVEASEPTVAQPVAVAPAVVAAPAAAVVDAAVEDAGAAPEPEVDAEIEVVRAGERLVGERVTLEGPGGEVGRTTDIMGFARLSLRPGRWEVKAPSLRETPYLDVRPEVSRYTIGVLFERLVSGSVRDDTGAPVALAAIRKVSKGIPHDLSRPSFTLSGVVGGKRVVIAGLAATSGVDGTFSFSTLDREVEIEATGLRPDGQEFRSPSRRVSAPASGVTLVLTRWGKARVALDPPIAPFFLFAQSPYGDVTAASDERSRVIRLPLGRVALTAQALDSGAVCTGRGEVVIRSEATEEVSLTATCASGIRGTVVDTTGRPLSGVAANIGCDTGIAPDPSGARPEFVHGRAFTNADGRFAFTPDQLKGVEQLCGVSLEEPWRPTWGVQVKLGDKPITIEASQTRKDRADDNDARRERERAVARPGSDGGLPAGPADSEALPR